MSTRQAKRATLKDVAQAAGVSSAAVSLVLNDKPNRFTDETKEHIRSIARELHYVPNQSARSLATKSSSLLAFFIPDIENLFFASLAKHLEVECKKRGYSLLVVDTSEDIDEQAQALQRMVQLGIDGLFIAPVYGEPSANKEFRDSLLSAGFPVVFIDRIPEKIQQETSSDVWSGLAYNHAHGGHLAASYFIEKGHTRLGIIGPAVQGELDPGNNYARFEGFLDELATADITIPTEHILNASFTVSAGRDNADKLLDAGVTGVFCGNDLIAIGFTRRARERGLRIPEDVSVIGYDDVMTSFGLDFEFTTVRQDVHDLAVQSCSAMVDHIHGNSSTERITLLQPQLMKRQTVDVPNDKQERHA